MVMMHVTTLYLKKKRLGTLKRWAGSLHILCIHSYSHSVMMQPPVSGALMLIFCLHLCCNALQNGTCNLRVEFIETAEKVSCFKTMDGLVPICRSHNSTQSCQIDYRDGKTCIKWPVDTDLTCVKVSDEIPENLINDEINCAHDQESISCDGEYKSDSEPGDSSSTPSLRRHREMYITDGADLDTEDSDDELPPMKFLLDDVQKQTTGTTECRTVTGLDSVIYLAVNGTVTNLLVFIQNILNCVPKTNKAFTSFE
ncbi:uncharacterized protein LOC131550601 isoform X2 [Onychostoma macrolepis]|uniref:uncharacterized protein LOC131550601 isoform X2 n=1 Tax=Onychostoma macrolepis TaxID=369639 RepID=UPI00272DA85C|nr:uncharacterized protein LOC131550601 isoform X2 [Onychostoma macrolepis]